MCEIAAGQEAGAMSPGGWERGRETDRVSGGGERARQSQLQDLGRKAPEGTSETRPEPRNGARLCLRRRPECQHMGSMWGLTPPGQAPFISKQG